MVTTVALIRQVHFSAAALGGGRLDSFDRTSPAIGPRELSRCLLPSNLVLLTTTIRVTKCSLRTCRCHRWTRPLLHGRKHIFIASSGPKITGIVLRRYDPRKAATGYISSLKSWRAIIRADTKSDSEPMLNKPHDSVIKGAVLRCATLSVT
jgi:hypothetical protein